MNFWREILRERGMIVGLAPMDGVTDAAFRWMVAKYGKPDVMYTEFVNVEGLMRGRVERLLPVLMYDEIERPIVAQLFGKTPEDFYRATVLVCELGFDGVDINMGCPAKNVAQKGMGAGLIKTPDLAQEIVRMVKKAVKDWSEGRVGLEEVAPDEKWLKIVGDFKTFILNSRKTGMFSGQRRSHPLTRVWRSHQLINQLVGTRLARLLRRFLTFKNESLERQPIPVSVKTRLGVEEDVSQWWMEVLSEVEPATIVLHGRTLKQMYSGEADWEAIGRAGEVVKKKGIVFLGNGDVKSVQGAKLKVQKYGVDGVLIGRASFGRLDIFADSYIGSEPIYDDDMYRFRTYIWMVEHSRKYEELFGKGRFLPMRKHLAWYARGFPGAKELRAKLVQCSSAEEVESLLARRDSDE